MREWIISGAIAAGLMMGSAAVLISLLWAIDHFGGWVLLAAVGVFGFVGMTIMTKNHREELRDIRGKRRIL